jgi:hypothetical protein
MRSIVAMSLALGLALGCGQGTSQSEPKPDPKAKAKPKPAPKPVGGDGADNGAATESIVLDAAYAAEHGYTLPARIGFEVPGGHLRRQSPPADQRVFLRLDQTSADGRPSEDLMITSLTIPPAEPDERIAFTRGLVESQGLARAMPAGAQVVEVREIEVGGMPAVLGIGEFEAQNSGKVYASMVAVILPEPQSFSIMAHHVAGNSEVKTPADVGQKGLLAAALSSMTIEP